MLGPVLQGAAALLLALAGFESSATTAPSSAFTVAPTNPAANSPVEFRDASSGSPASWRWDFGDGTTSTAQSPMHTYAAGGVYPVSLTAGNAFGQTATTQMVEVSPESTLRLIAGRGFDVMLEAEDPRTGHTGSGKAIPVNDVFGYFTLPDLVPTSGPLVPEVFVKILDATSIGQDYWVFWGGLTDLRYTLTVTETATGALKTFHNPATESPGCLGADTSGFGGPSSPTPSATATAPEATRTRTPTPSRTPTPPRAPSPTPAQTPVSTATTTATPVPSATSTPTATPGPSAIVVRLRAVYWQWDFVAGPDTSNTPPYPGVNTITLKKGLTYEFHIYNDGPVLDPPLPPHGFSGVAALGLSGASLETGGAESVQTITPNVTGDFPYLCTFTDCGTGANQHDAMHGIIRVVP